MFLISEDYINYLENELCIYDYWQGSRLDTQGIYSSYYLDELNGIEGIIKFNPITKDILMTFDHSSCFDKPQKCPLILKLHKPLDNDDLQRVKDAIDLISNNPEACDNYNYIDFSFGIVTRLSENSHIIRWSYHGWDAGFQVMEGNLY